MKTLDPYPPELLDEPSYPADAMHAPDPADPMVAALNRLAQAVEQLVLATLDKPAPNVAVIPPLATLPPVVDPTTFDGCPTHHQPWKVVPAGVSKRTGQAYAAFKACPVAGCDQRPRL